MLLERTALQAINMGHSMVLMNKHTKARHTNAIKNPFTPKSAVDSIINVLKILVAILSSYDGIAKVKIAVIAVYRTTSGMNNPTSTAI